VVGAVLGVLGVLGVLTVRTVLGVALGLAYGGAGVLASRSSPRRPRLSTGGHRPGARALMLCA